MWERLRVFASIHVYLGYDLESDTGPFAAGGVRMSSCRAFVPSLLIGGCFMPMQMGDMRCKNLNRSAAQNMHICQMLALKASTNG